MAIRCWWEWLAKLWLLAFHDLHDISNVHTKFDNNRSSSFGNYVYIKNGYRHQTDRQTRGHETSRKHKSGHSSDGLDSYYTSLAYAREVTNWINRCENQTEPPYRHNFNIHFFRSLPSCNKKQPPFYCKICHKPYNARRSLRHHVATHGEKKHNCDTCNKSYFHLFDLKNHIATQHEGRKIKCSMCNSEFNSKANLRSHMVFAHSRNFRYKCDECDQGYLTRDKLELHCKIQHEGFRYVCEVCKKTFKSQSQFNAHVKQHDPDGEEYKCDKCVKISVR